MTISVKDNKTQKEVICPLAYASDLIGLEENAIRRRLNPDGWFEYRHFTVNSHVKVIGNKKRGKPINEIMNK
jgi:hypothetical protein